MMRLLLLLIMFFALCTSCENKTYYYIDEISKDTIASACFVEKTKTKNSRYRIVIREIHNRFVSDDITNIISKLGLEEAFVSETGKEPYVFTSNIFVYDCKGRFSDIYSELYNDDNYYMQSRGAFYGKNSLHYSEFEEHEDIRNERARLSLQKEKVRKDSIAYILSRKEVELSFMEYKIGALYSKVKKKKLNANVIMNGDLREILDQNFRIGVQHYKDTIYKIVLYTTDYKNGIYTSGIESLYKTKYSDGNDGEVSSNSFFTKNYKSINISEEKLRFKNGQIIFEKTYGDDSSIGKVTEYSIIYLDPKLERKAKLKEEHEKEKRIQNEEKEWQNKQQEDFSKI